MEEINKSINQSINQQQQQRQIPIPLDQNPLHARVIRFCISLYAVPNSSNSSLYYLFQNFSQISQSCSTQGSISTLKYYPKMETERLSIMIGCYSKCSQPLTHHTGINQFGGLGVACWPLVPKFAGSNPAEAIGFLGVKKSSARLPSEGK